MKIIFPDASRKIREGWRPDPVKLWVILARGIGRWDGPHVINLQHDDVVGMQALNGAYYTPEGALHAINTTFGNIPDYEVHDSVVLCEWHGCAYRSPLIAYWTHQPRNGPTIIGWDQLPDGIL